MASDFCDDRSNWRADVGRWMRTNASVLRWRWAPWCCTLRPVLETPLAKQKCAALIKTLVLIGDSHTRLWAEHLGISKFGANSGYFASTHGVNRTGILHAPYMKLITHALRSKEPGEVVIVVAHGHHGLRDDSVENVIEREASFVHSLAGILRGGGLTRTTLIWRTAPAFSYRRTLFKQKEHRTNEKLSRLRDAIVEYVHIFAAANDASTNLTIDMHDTYGFSSPRFAESADTHHYMYGPTVKNVQGYATERHEIGKADLNAFLNAICRPA